MLGAYGRVRPTIEGWIYLATALAVALAALNTGNNLLYLVFAAMLALVALSGVLSEASLRRVRAERSLEGRVFAGEPSTGTWVLTSERRLVPALALRLRELPSRHADLGDCTGATFAFVPAGQSERAKGSWTFTRRGVHRLAGVRISTTWPFGILRKSRDVRAPVDVLVFPPRGAPQAGEPGGALDGERPRGGRKGGTGELLGVRAHRDGEDLRLVHWKTSARLRRRVVVEREQPAGGWLELHLQHPGGTPEEAGQRFEAELAGVTGALWQAVERDRSVRLHLPDGDALVVEDSEQRDRALAHLAVLPGPRGVS